MPKVSICIPTYNQTHYLQKTLESILIQTYQDYEVIISDDSSSPVVQNLIKDYHFDGKLRYYHNEIPLGSPQNWNVCISKARGELIKIMHHDDCFSFNNSLEKFVKILDDNPTFFFAFSSSQSVSENELYNSTHTVSSDELIEIQDHPILLFKGNKIGAPSAVIFRKENISIFDIKMKWLVDINFYIDTLRRYKGIGYIDNSHITIYAPEDRVTNICINDKAIEIFEYFYLFEKIRKSYGKSNSYDLSKCFNHLLNICDKYNITKISEIRECGYYGHISVYIQVYLLLLTTFRESKFYFFVKRKSAKILQQLLSNSFLI